MSMSHAPDAHPDAPGPAMPARTPAAADAQALAQALRDLPPQVDEAEWAAWQARVMGDWRRAVARPAWRRVLDAALARGGMTARPTAAAGLPSGSQGRGGAGWRRPAAAGLLGLALWAAWVGWQRQRDAALEELMQPDVLSQMAAGEM